MNTKTSPLRTYFRPMRHHPTPPPRMWFYAATGYLMPVVVQVAFPDDPALTDELVWLLMLGPAFLLALHYGIRGAFAALVLGTSLFAVVQVVVALNFTPDDWRITMPTYLAYGVLSVAIGWLSEEMHEFYGKAISQARLAAIGETAVTVVHHLNNDLTALVTEADLLLDQPDQLTTEQRAALREIIDIAMRAAKGVADIDRLAAAPVDDYLDHSRILDLRPAISS